MKLKGSWEEQIGTNYSVESVKGAGGEKHEINVGALGKQGEERGGRAGDTEPDQSRFRKKNVNHYVVLFRHVCLSGGSVRRGGGVTDC